jgi:hypothetical protein
MGTMGLNSFKNMGLEGQKEKSQSGFMSATRDNNYLRSSLGPRQNPNLECKSRFLSTLTGEDKVTIGSSDHSEVRENSPAPFSLSTGSRN